MLPTTEQLLQMASLNSISSFNSSSIVVIYKVESAFISRTKISQVLMKRKLAPCLQHGFIRSLENVIVTNIENTVDGTSLCVANGVPCR